MRQDIADRFSWTCHDVRSLLPPGWAEAVLELSTRGVLKLFVPNALTSREEDTATPLPVCEVAGDVVRRDLPWLFDCYRGIFRDLAQRSCGEEISPARCDRYGVILNVLRGQEMRYVCHVDSNPVAGLLYVTGHPPGAGGELVVANNRASRSTADVEKDCTIIHPTAGQLLFFDGRYHPHYVRPLRGACETRVVVAMNFYTPSCPETSRPFDLDAGIIVDPTG